MQTDQAGGREQPEREEGWHCTGGGSDGKRKKEGERGGAKGTNAAFEASMEDPTG